MSQALCIKTESLFGEHIPEDNAQITFKDPSKLFQKETFLIDRKICEKDQSYLQVIPYVTLYDPNICCFFIYQRGESGGEKGLHGRCSVGLGGHVELVPENGNAQSFIDVLATEASRELEEETGLTTEDIPLDKIKRALAEENFGLIHARATDVDKVHLGLSLVFNVDHSRVTKTEENVISKGEWLTFGEIYEKALSNEIELETWSKMVLQTINLRDNLKFPSLL